MRRRRRRAEEDGRGKDGADGLMALAYHISGNHAPESYCYTNYFEAMDGAPDEIRIADPTPDGASLIMPQMMIAGRPILPDHVPTKLRRGGPATKVQPLLDVNRWIDGVLLVPQAYQRYPRRPGAGRAPALPDGVF